MRIGLLLGAVATLAACGGSDATTTPTPTLVGTYSLFSVNGATLPITLQAANPKNELVAEQLVVNAGGTFTIATTTRTTSSTGAVSTATSNGAGTYSTSGTATLFQFGSGNPVTASLNGNRLTLTAATSTSVYVKS